MQGLQGIAALGLEAHVHAHLVAAALHALHLGAKKSLPDLSRQRHLSEAKRLAFRRDTDIHFRSAGIEGVANVVHPFEQQQLRLQFIRGLTQGIEVSTGKFNIHRRAARSGIGIKTQ